MRRINARWIPKMLTDDQKHMQKESCKRILGRFQQEGRNFMERIVTVDETWISDEAAIDYVEDAWLPIPQEV